MIQFKVELLHPPYRGPAESARTPKREAAALQAAEWLIAHPDALVYATHGARRWRLALTPQDAIRWTELYSDGIAAVPAEVYERRRLRHYAGHVQKQEQRRQARKSAAELDKEAERRERADKFCQGVRRPVVCLDTAVAYATVVEAAQWVGVKQHSTLVVAIQRGRRCGRLRWQYADVLIKELENESQLSRKPADHGDVLPEPRPARRPNFAALRAAAQHALSLRQREKIQGVLRVQADLPGDLRTEQAAQARQVIPPTTT